MLRRDTTKLGRVSEMLERDKDLKRQRKAFDTDEGTVAKDVEEVKGLERGDEGDGSQRPSKKARSEAGSKIGGKSNADGEGKKKKKRKNKKGDGQEEGSERG